jgi:hypothetical protein
MFGLFEDFLDELKQPEQVTVVVLYSKATPFTRQLVLRLIQDENCEVWAAGQHQNEATRMMSCLVEQNRYGSRNCGHVAEIQNPGALKELFQAMGKTEVSTIVVVADEGQPNYSTGKIFSINAGLLNAMQGHVTRLMTVIVTGRHWYFDQVCQKHRDHERQWKALGAEFVSALFAERPGKLDAKAVAESAIGSSRIKSRIKQKLASLLK